MNKNNDIYLKPTPIIDNDNPIIKDCAKKLSKDANGAVEIAIKLYLFVRDAIRYDPYSPFYLPEHYRASNVLKRGKSFCIPKASLLCALCRACGIPSRIGLADVRNHLATRQLLNFMGSDIFVYHGFVEIYLEGKWLKATPAFNRELCERHNVAPLEFNGREDSIFQLYNLNKQKFMEYIGFHGIYADIPVEEIVRGWKEAYGEDRVNRWIQMFEEKGYLNLSDFEKEDIFDE